MVITILLTLLLASSVFLNITFVRRIRLYEGYIMITMQAMRSAYFRMKSIDDQGLFESDDEVGAIFSDLAESVYQLYDIVDVSQDYMTISEDEEEKGDA